MTEPDLKFLVDQNARILSELRGIRDDLKYLQARAGALEAQHHFDDALALFRSAAAQEEHGKSPSGDRVEFRDRSQARF
jgi:hypothetical protein